MPCCSSCAGANRNVLEELTPRLAPTQPLAGARRPGGPFLRRPGGPVLIRAGQPLGFVRPLLSLVSAVNMARALGAPEGCGGAYMHLVQASSSRSKAAPYGFPGMWCNVEDATAWHQSVESVKDHVTTAARGLEPKDVPPELAAWFSMVSQLEKPSEFMAFGFGNCAEVVASYIAAIEGGACMLELLEGAGATPLIPDIGPVPDSPGDILGSATTSLAIGAGLLFLAYVALTNRGSK